MDHAMTRRCSLWIYPSFDMVTMLKVSNITDINIIDRKFNTAGSSNASSLCYALQFSVFLCASPQTCVN